MTLQYSNLLDKYSDTTVIFGEDCFEQFVGLLEKNDTKKVAAFTGGESINKNGAWSRMLNAAGHLDTEFVRFFDIEPEPCVETVEKMLAFLKQEEPDQVLAIGGGSVMDAAKAAYICYQTGKDIDKFFGVNKYSSNKKAKPLKKIACFPTTSGTGSEVTPFSCIVDKKVNVKKVIFEKQIIPEYAFLAPQLTLTSPKSLTLATGCDALAHSLEGFLNTRMDDNNPDANTWAIESIKMIVENLPKALKDPDDIKAREALSAAACMGGMVIGNKSTGLPHLCSFSWFGKIPHGLAVAILLPYAWDYYIAEPSVKKRTLELKGVFSKSDKTAEDVINSYCKFIESCGVKTALKDVKGITKKLLKETAEAACENQMKLDLAPRPIPVEKSTEILTEILNNAWAGR